MTWIKFALWLLGCYTFYYAALIFWDYFRSNGQDSRILKHELTFAEDIQPARSLPDDPDSFTRESPVTFSGGVSLKQLFNLAREEAIEYIRPVSF
jgi:hypothetical protein